MLQAILDLTVRRNATWAPTIVLPYLGAQLPLTGAHIAIQFRAYQGAPDAILTINPVPFADLLVAGSAGQPDEVRWLTLSPSASLSEIAQPQPALGGDQTYYHDIRVTYADGLTAVLAAGKVIVSPGVTTV